MERRGFIGRAVAGCAATVAGLFGTKASGGEVAEQERAFSHDDVRCIAAMKILRERKFCMIRNAKSCWSVVVRGPQQLVHCLGDEHRIVKYECDFGTAFYADPVEAILDADAAFPAECKIPPSGWSFSRESGHQGPCAARPE